MGSEKQRCYANDVLLSGESKENLIQDWDGCMKIVEDNTKPIVTFFGSARSKPSTLLYKFTRELAKTLGSQDFAVLSGGGPGFMEAANKGATDAGALSLGIRSLFLRAFRMETTMPGIHDKTFDALHLTLRQFFLQTHSMAHIYLPGGFGTYAEFFWSCIGLQTNTVNPVPVILIQDRRRQWDKLRKHIESVMLESGYISATDMDLFSKLWTVSKDTFEECLGDIVDIIVHERARVEKIRELKAALDSLASSPRCQLQLFYPRRPPESDKKD